MSQGAVYRVTLRQLAIAAAVFVPLAFLLHWRAFTLGWWGDDPYILENAIFLPWLDFFWKPEVYQQLSLWNFTPMLVPSYGVDYALFGLAPAGFYAHQVLVLGLLAGAIAALAWRWGSFAAFAAGALFSVSGPATICAQSLMTRHYVEGGLFALVCVLLLVSTTRLGLRALLAGVAYACAVLSKELYVPLALAAPWIVGGGVRRGLLVSAPVLCVLALYVPLRLRMLSDAPRHWSLPWEQLTSPGWYLESADAVASMWSGAQDGLAPWAALVLVALALHACYVLWRRGRATLAALVCAGALGPMLPLWNALGAARLVEYRYAFHLAIVVALFAVYPVRAAAARGARWGAGVLVAIVLVLLGAAQPDVARANAEARARECRRVDFLLEHDAADVLVLQGEFSYWPSIRAIRRELRGEETPRICSVPFDLRGEDARYVFLAEDREGFRVVDVTDDFLATKAALLAGADEGAFAVELEFRGGTIELSMDGGEPGADYRFLRGWESGVYVSYPVTATSQISVYRSPHDVFVRALKITRAGKFVLSPEWRLAAGRDEVIRWSR